MDEKLENKLGFAINVLQLTIYLNLCSLYFDQNQKKLEKILDLQNCTKLITKTVFCRNNCGCCFEEDLRHSSPLPENPFLLEHEKLGNFQLEACRSTIPVITKNRQAPKIDILKINCK